MRKLFAGFAMVVAAVAMTGCSSSASTSTTTEPSTTTSTAAANSVVGTVKWATTNKAVVTTLSSDVAALGTALPGAVSSTDPSTVTASCQKLATDVATAMALSPIPNSTAQQLWSSLLSGLSTAAQKCTDGASKNDSGEFEPSLVRSLECEWNAQEPLLHARPVTKAQLTRVGAIATIGGGIVTLHGMTSGQWRRAHTLFSVTGGVVGVLAFVQGRRERGVASRSETGD